MVQNIIFIYAFEPAFYSFLAFTVIKNNCSKLEQKNTYQTILFLTSTFGFQITDIRNCYFHSDFFPVNHIFIAGGKLALKTYICFFPINDTLFDFTKHLKIIFDIKKSTDFLA